MRISQSKVLPECPHVVALPRQCVTARVSQHMRMGLERKAGFDTCSFDHFRKARLRERLAAPRCKHEFGPDFLLELDLAQGSKLSTQNAMGAWQTIIEPAHRQGR